MSSPPDPSLTVKSLLEDNWSNATANPRSVPTPLFTTPADQKRTSTADQDLIHVYSVTATDTKRGVSNAYRDRVDYCTIDITTMRPTGGLARRNDLWSVVEGILDLTTVRSSPSTRPAVATYADSYTANTYDQIIPISHTTKEDVNRRWYRVLIEVECRAFWEAR